MESLDEQPPPSTPGERFSFAFPLAFLLPGVAALHDAPLVVLLILAVVSGAVSGAIDGLTTETRLRSAITFAIGGVVLALCVPLAIELTGGAQVDVVSGERSIWTPQLAPAFLAGAAALAIARRAILGRWFALAT